MNGKCDGQTAQPTDGGKTFIDKAINEMNGALGHLCAHIG